MPSHLRCAAGRAIQAWASIWIVRALSNIAIGRRTCLFPQAAQPPIRNAADLVSISSSEVQPGDLRVYMPLAANRGTFESGALVASWIECCYGYGVAVNMSNAGWRVGRAITSAMRDFKGNKKMQPGVDRILKISY